MLTPKSGHDDEIDVVEIQTPVEEEGKDPYMIDSEELEFEENLNDNVL